MNPQSDLWWGRGRAVRRGIMCGLFSVFLLAACDRSADTDPSSSSSDPSSATTGSDQPATTTSSAPTTTMTPTSTTVDPSAEVLLAWDAFWDAWAEVRASDALNPAPLQDVADPTVVDGVIALFEGPPESEPRPVVTTVVTHTNVTELGPGEAKVEDCVLLSPSFTDSVGVWFSADLRNTGSGWVVSDLRIPSLGGCVPQEMAAEAIAAYDAYYVAEAEFWDPPNPDHPLIGEVLAEPQASFVVDLLVEHQSRGVALRGQPTTHPEVIEVRGPNELVILSCLEPASEFGLYDLETGERVPDEPPVGDGQRDLESAVMLLQDGKWKVSDLQGQVDFACEFAPTERGLPSI